MSGIVLAGTLALAALGSGDPMAHAPKASPTVFDQARARQPFYPVGAIQGDGMTMAYYAMGGTCRFRARPTPRAPCW